MRQSIIIILVAIFVLAGCKKFLDVQPKDLKIAKTVKDYQDLMNGEGWSKSNSDNLGVDFFWLDILTDDVGEILPTSSIPVDVKKHYGSFYTWRNQYDLSFLDNTTSKYNLDTWTWLYRVVNISNIVIEGLENASGDEREKEQLKAEAYFSRALAYYYILNIWGEPYNPSTAATAKGVPLKVTAYPDLASQPRNSVQEGYDFINNDLKEAERLIKLSSITKSVFHVSEVAINILQSRMFLYTQNWTKAKEYADKAIALKPELYDITAENFTTTTTTNFFNSRNKEIVFSYFSSSRLPVTASNYIFGSSQNSGIYVMSNELLNLYVANDKRKNGFLSSPKAGVFVAKTMLQETATPTSLFDQSIRVGEAYLNRAEALAQLNDPSNALKDLNALRMKRITGATDVNIVDKTLLLDFIYQERRREFVFQTHRWFDLRRTGMPSITHYYTPVNGIGAGSTIGATLKYVLNQNDPGYTIELPLNERNLNPQLLPLGLAERQAQ